MSGFADILIHEQTAINTALNQSVQALPPFVREVAGYGLLAGGKRLRPLLTLLTVRLLNPQMMPPYPLATVLEMVHVATLLHDDILDDAPTRRGKEATHVRFGVTPCLLAGDALMAQATSITASYGKPALMECLADATVRTVEGETQEIALKGSLDHGLESYLEIITGKTGWLLRAACRMGAIYADAEGPVIEALSQYGLNLGLGFQMVDDALDFADEAVTGKPTGGDLREGKCTPPIVGYAAGLSEIARQDFAAKFAVNGFSDDEVVAISRRIREQGHDSRTREEADAYLGQAAKALDHVPHGPEREVLLQALDYVRDRNK